MRRVGVVFGSLTPAEELAAGARAAEAAGFSEQWFSEDCFFSGGLSGVTQLLASTKGARAGLGLVSVVARHPAVLAMEVAGIARMHPGRLRVAVGLGSESWVRQMGLMPDRPLTAVRETIAVLRDLLAGSTVDRSTTTHEFHGIRLDLPPAQVPEIWLGAVNERALKAGGEIADGVLLSVLAGPSYLGWATGLTGGVPVTAYVLAAVDDDPAAARDAVRGAVGFFLQAESRSSLVTRSRYADEVLAAVAELAPGESLTAPDHWIDEFAAAGTPDQVAERLRALLDAGADSLGLWLFPPDRLTQQIQRIASEVLPKLEQS
ncbi:LLM class flavin-dependent oxidoreductase [Kribbella monticola]|uniref:LLM class flavin-dependent oxidoreductase n=1 Tax=Kribbella monticola TaxID=2185285 RepID=UPI000DD48CD7|nr:LLM class flavin-dependent oxidoreductase [Kribbella monticola]